VELNTEFGVKPPGYRLCSDKDQTAGVGRTHPSTNGRYISITRPIFMYPRSFQRLAKAYGGASPGPLPSYVSRSQELGPSPDAFSGGQWRGLQSTTNFGGPLI
jgi:hypothetical protein